MEKIILIMIIAVYIGKTVMGCAKEARIMHQARKNIPERS